jgi:hypothetical protein
MIKVPLFVTTIFTDPGWRQVGRYKYFREFDGMKNGVVLATMSPQYDRFALNTPETKDLLAGKRNNKVDQAFIVAAKGNGAGKFEFYAGVDAEEFHKTVLATLVPRSGPFGDFWTIAPYDFDPDAPF